MAQDRFIHWDDPSQMPTHEQVRVVLEDFFAGVATAVEWRGDRFFVDLPGACTPALHRIEGARARGLAAGGERWIEVFLHTSKKDIGIDEPDATIDVLTRDQDEMTNALAAGVVRVLSEYWKGQAEP